MTTSHIAYVRFSTDSQDDKGQLERLATLGLTFDEVFTDRAVSSLTRMADRPAGSALMNYIGSHTGEVNIYVTEVSRLGRDSVNNILFAREVATKGNIHLHSVNDGRDIQLPTNEMIFTIKSAVMAEEKRTVNARCLAGVAKAKLEGVYDARSTPLATLKAIYEYKANGFSQRSTARHLGVSNVMVSRWWNREEDYKLRLKRCDR